MRHTIILLNKLVKHQYQQINKTIPNTKENISFIKNVNTSKNVNIIGNTNEKYKDVIDKEKVNGEINNILYLP